MSRSLLTTVALIAFAAGCIAPPTPPGPRPPEPPTPPAPVAAALNVLIVEETADRHRLPPSVVDLFFDPDVRDYLDAHCDKDAAGHPEWRLWDQDIDASNEPAKWREALARPRSQLPWIVITNGKAGTEGPLPRTEDELLATLKKWGGP